MSIFVNILLISAAMLFVALVVFIGYLWYWLNDSRLFDVIAAYIDDKDAELIRYSIDTRVGEFVRAAEYMVGSGEMSDDVRWSYIDRCLHKVGLENDELVKAKIMSAIYDTTHRK